MLSHRHLLLVFIILLAQMASAQPQNKTGITGSQQTSVLLVGTLHRLPWPITYNYNALEDLSRDFKPQVICVEYTPVDDTISMNRFYSTRLLHNSDSVRHLLNTRGINISRQIDSIYSLLQISENFSARAELINLLFANRDFGNADFQSYLLGNKLDDIPAEKRNGLDPDKYNDAFNQKHKRDEFGRMVFPIAMDLGISYLYPIDNHTYEVEYNEAMEQAIRDLEGTPIYEQAQSKLSSLQWGSLLPALFGNLGLKMNSYEFQYIAESLEAHRFPDSVSKAYTRAAFCFERRNELMAANVAAVAQANTGKRIIVFVGASHIPFMRRYLKKFQFLNVLTIPDMMKH